jgi:hypothetical protein
MEAFEKLTEAKYFLTKMNESIDDRAVFKFNLSAFLSSGRSVTWYLQKEYAHNSKFKEWYPKKQDEMEKDPVLQFFNEKRVAVVHIKTIDVRGHHEVTLTETIGPISDSVTIELRDANGNIIQTGTYTSEPKPVSQEKTDEPKIIHKWFFTDFNETEIIPLCSKYIESLQTIVEEASKNI